MERRQISICIPTFQRAALLKRTLTHLSEISDIDMEVVISDNASTDETPEVARSFEERFTGFRYHRQRENRGSFENTQMAISLASSECSYVLCDDDQIVPAGIQAALRLMDERRNLVAVYGGHQEWDADGDRILATCQKVKELQVYYPGEELKVINTFSAFQWPLVRTSIFQRFCFFNRYSHGTRRIVAKLLNFGSIAFIPQIFYKHAHTVPRYEYSLTEGFFHDEYRSDYELFFAEMDLDFNNADRVSNITQFIRSRVVPAYLQGVRFARLKGEYLTERNFLMRAKVYGLVNYDKLQEWERQFLLFAVAERLWNIIKGMPEIKTIVVEKTPVMSHFIKLLSERFGEELPDIKELEFEAIIEIEDHPETFFFAEQYGLLEKRLERYDTINPAKQHALYDLIASLRLTRKPLNLQI